MLGDGSLIYISFQGTVHYEYATHLGLWGQQLYDSSLALFHPKRRKNRSICRDVKNRNETDAMELRCPDVTESALI